MTANNAFKFMLRKNQSRFIKNKISRQMYDRTTEIIVWWYKSIIEILGYSKSLKSRFTKNKISRQKYNKTTEIIVWWYKSIIEILDYSKSFFNDLDFYKNIAATAVFVK